MARAERRLDNNGIAELDSAHDVVTYVGPRKILSKDKLRILNVLQFDHTHSGNIQPARPSDHIVNHLPTGRLYIFAKALFTQQ